MTHGLSKPVSSTVVTISNNSHELTTCTIDGTRQGQYDKDVQIFREGKFLDGLLHQVRVGDCFCTLDNPQRWFGCLSPITKSYSNMRSKDCEDNPTFNMSGLEVLQAKPIEDQPAKYLPSEHTSHWLTVTDIRKIGEPEKAIGNWERPKSSEELDIDDVDFKEL
jgi:hypothetical protein